MITKLQVSIFNFLRRAFFFSFLVAILFFIPLSLSAPGHEPKVQQTKTLLSDGRWLILGGSSNEIVDPKTGKSTLITSDIFQSRIGQTATVLPDGTVFIFGGVDANGNIRIGADILHLDTLTFEHLASLVATARTDHTATLLSNGKVLIVGGSGNNRETLPSAELYDWQRGTIEIVPSNLAFARRGHKAALQADGSVVFWGGKDNRGNKLQNAERFDPESQHFDLASRPSEKSAAAELAASLPSQGENNVSLDTVISLRFTRPLAVQSVNKENATLSSVHGPTEFRMISAESGMLIFITPDQKLLSSTTYNFTLNNLHDREGNPIAPIHLKFSTVGESVPKTPSEEGDDEVWNPEPTGYFEKWRTGRSKSPWQSLQALKAPDGVTAVSGQALKLNGNPLKDVTIRLGDVWVQTDDTGRFLANNITPGVRQMIIDGRTANHGNHKYGIYVPRIDVDEGITNVLRFTIWMTELDMEHAIDLPSPTQSEIVVTTPKITGLEVHIPAGTVIRDIDGQVVTKFSITPIPMDRGPMPGPVVAVDFPYLFTLQPGGSTVEGPGISIVHPNYAQALPGKRIPFWRPDKNVGWMIYGYGTVSGDGQKVLPDPDAVVPMLSCSALGDPNTAPLEGPKCLDLRGDPVSCSTGLYVESNTDLYLPDVIPISLTRTYRTNDLVIRPFGYGSTHSYEIFLVGDTVTYSYADLILADGSKIHYNRISEGTGFGDAIMEHTSTGGEFYKSLLSWNSSLALWDLKFRNGMIYQFFIANAGYHPDKVMLSAIIDRNGNKLTIDHDLFNSDPTARGRTLRITSPNGKWINFTYLCSTCTQVTQATDNIGRIVTYTYNGNNLWKVTNAIGGITEYTFEPGTGRRLTVKNPRGFIHVTNEYNAAGRVFRQTRTDNTTYQYAYTLDGNGKVIQTDVTNPRGYIERLTFNSDGEILTRTKAVGQPEEQVFTYERQSGTNLLLSVTDGLGRKTTYTYDVMGYATSITAMDGTPDSATTIMTYEPTFNQVTTLTNPLNHTTTFTYDAKGNLIKTTDPLGNSSLISYNSSGQPISMTDPFGNTTQFSYQAGHLVSQTNPLGYSVTQFTDAAGRVITKTNSLGQIVRYEYDTLNRMTRSIDPLQGATTFAYDPNSNLLSITDARNNPTSYSYNNMDYGQNRTDPLLRVENYLYDNNGNLRELTDRKNQITTYTYDGLDRLKQIEYNDGSTIDYTYDDGDRITQVIDSIAGTITMGYDNFDHLTSQVTPQGTVNYTYDDDGRRETMTIAGQPTANYFYDDADRLTQITQGSSTVTITYDAAGRRTSMTLPNGIVSDYVYDRASQLIAITYRQNSSVIGELTYEYDTEGRRTKIGGSFARTGLPDALNSATYNGANHQLTFGSQSLTYDNNGNLTNDGINTYTWNARNQLIGLSGPGITATFQYDGLFRRINKTVNGISTAFLYDGDNPTQELSGGTPNANLLNGLGIDEFFSRTDSSGARHLLTDGLNNTIALTDSNAIVQSEYKYEPFGKVTLTGSANDNSYQYTGRENDGTGLYFYRERYYHSLLKRFLGEDSIAFKGGINLYSYVENNPVNFNDPLGMERLDSQRLQDLKREAEAMGKRMQKDGPVEIPIVEAYGFAEQLRVWGQHTFPGEENSEMRHCVVTCIMALTYGDEIALTYGDFNEIQGFIRWDIPDIRGRLSGERAWAFSSDDLFANIRGVYCSYEVRKEPLTPFQTNMNECIQECAVNSHAKFRDPNQK